MGVPGVANVATWGMRDRQLQVQVDPDRLRGYQVSLLQLLESVGNALWVSTLSFVVAATPGNAGFIDTPQQRLGIQHISPIISPESLGQVSVQGTGSVLIAEAPRSLVPKQGGAVRLVDVADVVEDHQPLIGDALPSDGASLLLVIEKAPGTDTVKVTRAVEDALATLRAGLGGMQIDSTIFRPATFIEMARDNLTRGVLIASVVIVLMIGLCVFNWRAALISLIIIPLSLIATALILYLLGATMNIMVVIGLVIASGVIVDDAIIVVDNIVQRWRRLQSHGSGEMPRSPGGVILDTVLETRGTMLFATLICLLPVLPVFALRESAGAFFQPLAVSYVLAVTSSAFIALIVTPALAAMLLPSVSGAPPDYAASPLIRRLEAGHSELLERILSRPRPAYLTIAILAGVGLGMLPFLRPTALPTFKERDLLIRLEAMRGTSHPEMVRLVDRVLRELRDIPGVHNVGGLVGRAVFGDRTVGMNSAELCVNIAPTADYGATVGAIHTAMKGYPGLKSEVQTYLERVSSRVTAQASAPIVVRVYGQDWPILRGKAEELGRDLSTIAGVTDMKIDVPMEEPTLEVEVDVVAAQRHGINPGSVRRAASTLMNGLQVGSLFQEQKVFDVVVWSTPTTRDSVTDVRNLLISTPFAVPVRVGDVAKVSIMPRPSLITREDVSRYVDVGLNVNGRAAGFVKDEIRRRLREFQFPLEYHAEVFGSYEQRQSARNRLLAFAAIALIGIVLLLQAAFDSWRLAILSVFTLALALVGGLVALLGAEARNVSLAAVFGLLAVFGIAARNQIMLIRRFGQLTRDRGESSHRELLLQGTRERFAPLVTTALTIASALVPLLLMGDVPGLEVLRPTAIVILCGLVTCALVDLLVVPSLYLRFARNRP